MSIHVTSASVPVRGMTPTRAWYRGSTARGTAACRAARGRRRRGGRTRRPGRGDREVVHHRRAAERDLLAVHERAARIDHVVPQPRRAHDVVAEEHELAGAGVELRVRGHRRAERAAEVGAADGAEVVAHLGREAHLDDREEPVVERHDVRVRPARPADEHVVGLTGRRRLAELLARAVGAHPAVPVARLPARQLDAVQHPVTGEPVVRARVGVRHRVRAVAHEQPVELRRQRPGDLEVGVVTLVADRARSCRSGTGSSRPSTSRSP